MSRLGAVSLLVRDYDEALSFYVGKLGFEPVENMDMGGGKRWVTVRPKGGETVLLLARATTDEQRAQVGDQAGGRVWLFLERFREAPRHEGYGKVAVFEDLYGNAWDLIEPARTGD